MSRLRQHAGERIDRSQPIAFQFDGRRVEGFAGDTIVSALYASGQRVFSRSFKYHRPRGELCACGQCANSLFQIEGAPGIRGCGEPARDGMVVTHQNAWPSLRFDVMRVTDRVGGPFTPVGFYYKTFIRPRRLWPLYEKVLRRAAGLGRLPARQDERRWETDVRRRRCDVLVVGGGIAGLTAAVAAARDGADVVLCDEDADFGGVAASEGRGEEIAALVAQARDAGVELLCRAPALGFYDGLVPIWQGDTLHQVRADRHVLATGALQQPLVFSGNDLPGVMLSGGARRLAALYAVKPGERAVVVTADDRGIDDALALQALGVEIAAVADMRANVADDNLADLAAAAGIEILAGTTIVRALGRNGVTCAALAPVDAGGVAQGVARRVDCDLVAVAGGSAPSLSLLLQAGGRARYDEGAATFVVDHVPPGIEVAGALAQTPANVATPPAYASDGGRGKAFVDLDEDVTVKDIVHAADEGYDSLELSKRYTTVTMGPSQGRFSQLASARVLAAQTGLDLQTIGLTTARPPWSTVPMAVLAGRPFEAARRTAIHAAHRELGADIRWAGDWRRPYDYGDAEGETAAVHAAAGLIDVSTLGKLLVRGPQAGELLDRLYPGPMSTLEPGRIRYGLMTSESGRITDDGTVVRLDEDTFYVTTTTSGAAGVESQMSWWLEVWGLDATVTDVTQGLGAVNLAGPKAREILAGLTDLDVSAQAFGYLRARQAKVAGVECVLMRIGFVGEVGYEIHCAGVHARHVWDAIMDAGAPLGLRPFGLEPQRVLRLQKAHIIVGQDTNSEMTPFGARLEWAVDFDKPQAFIGRWALQDASGRVPHEILVGFTVPSGEPPQEGSAVFVDGAAAGEVSSVRRSAKLGMTIGMCTVPPDLAREGARIVIADDGRRIEAVVTTKPFYDPEGEVVRG